MAKPWIHAQSSAKRFGGKPDDYLEVHDFMDSSKAAFPDNRHRALTHNSWFIFVVEKVFGHNIKVSAEVSCPACKGSGYSTVYDRIRKRDIECFCATCEGDAKVPKQVSVRDICEQHILEDFGNKYIPSPQDYLEHMTFQPWMNNGIEGAPSSHRKVRPTNQPPKEYLLD